MANFDKKLNLDIKLPFKFVHRQLFMPFLMSYVSTLYSQYFLGSTLAAIATRDLFFFNLKSYTRGFCQTRSFILLATLNTRDICSRDICTRDI